MKIIHVISALTKGGGEKVMVELANEAVKRGIKVTALVAWPVNPEFLQNSLDSNVELIFLAQSRNKAYLKMPFWIIRNRKLLSTYNVLHVHLTFGTLFGTMAYVILKKIFRLKQPVITETNHAVGMLIAPFKRKLQAYQFRFRNGVAFMAMDPYWEKFCKAQSKLIFKIIPNGISTPHLTAPGQCRKDLLEKNSITTNPVKLLGTVGMLRADRNPLLYVHLFEIISKMTGPDVHFILGGDGEEFDKIKNLVAEKGLSKNFHMPGLVQLPAPFIAPLDLYVSVGVRNTSGISMLEAALLKVPVVGIQLTQGYKARADDWFWSDTDLQIVAERIVTLLQNEEELKLTGAKQYNYVQKEFSAAAMLDAYISFYKEIDVKK